MNGQHVSEPEVVARVANEAGLDGGRRWSPPRSSPKRKARLRQQTDDAIAAGVFGVPSMAVGDEVFWGYDDFPYLDTYLAGEDPLPSLDAPQFNTAPVASAMRKQMAGDGGSERRLRCRSDASVVASGTVTVPRTGRGDASSRSAGSAARVRLRFVGETAAVAGGLARAARAGEVAQLRVRAARR